MFVICVFLFFSTIQLSPRINNFARILSKQFYFPVWPQFSRRYHTSSSSKLKKCMYPDTSGFCLVVCIFYMRHGSPERSPCSLNSCRVDILLNRLSEFNWMINVKVLKPQFVKKRVISPEYIRAKFLREDVSIRCNMFNDERAEESLFLFGTGIKESFWGI